MTFRPFGFPISLYSPLPPDECRRRLRTKLLTGFERPAALRPRGKLIGQSFLVIWLGAYDWINKESEPKLILRLRKDGTGTSIKGRAIPGIQFLLFLIPAALFAIWGSTKIMAYRPDHAPADPMTYLIVKFIICALPLAFVASLWLVAHWQSKTGRPMISFLKRTLAARDVTPPSLA
ncbi:hypothetical protein GGR44_001468 [Sphingobium fontiphilum]|uniref:Uncharacterized protein n=1 Tax=Sphingobium fontiphilum TaxID=944425 RepID=A0A7W6DMP6_9SPHN|nr:hypothetical protein [Sphingobium fontiphilum]MBB3981809.1 hypothetical protein [Sphingobium fontiphilum]